MRSHSIWVPVVITGAAAAVTVAVLAQRHARSSAKPEERRRSDGASRGAPGARRGRGRVAAGRPAPPPAPAPPRPFPLGTADFDVKPRTERGASLDRSPEIAERGEVYDAVNTDDLGAEWLTRATESLPARRSPLPEPELRFDPIEGERISDADLVLESESPHTEGSEAHSKRTRPPPRVFDVADLPPEQDARTTKTRNS